MSQEYFRENCPFCNVKVKDSVWLETEDFRVIYNIAPVVSGHSLVIPKKHITSLLDLDELALSEIFQVARKAISILLEVFRGEGFDLAVQDGEVAGQTVPHLHVHIMPRKQNDLSTDEDWHQQILDSDKRPRLTNDELGLIVKQLREKVVV